MKTSSSCSIYLISMVLLVCLCNKIQCDFWLDPNVLLSPCTISFWSEELLDFQSVKVPIHGKMCIFRSLNDPYPETILYLNRTYHEYPVTKKTLFYNPSVLATCTCICDNSLLPSQHRSVLNCTKMLQIHKHQKYFCFYKEFESECNNSTDNAVTHCMFEIFKDEDRRQGLYEGFYTGEPTAVFEFQLVLRNSFTGDVLNYTGPVHLRIFENSPGSITIEDLIEVASDEKLGNVLLPQWLYINPMLGKIFAGVELNSEGEFDFGKYGSFQTEVSGKMIEIPHAVLHDSADITSLDCDKNYFPWVFRAKGYHNYGQSDPSLPGYRLDIKYRNTVSDVRYEDGKIRFYPKNQSVFQLKLRKAIEKSTMTTSTTEGFNLISTDPTPFSTPGSETTDDPSDEHETTPKSTGSFNPLWFAIVFAIVVLVAGITIYVCKSRKQSTYILNHFLDIEALDNPLETLNSSNSHGAMEQLIVHDNDC